MKITRLDDLQLFVYAAESGSFSAAARRLDLSPVVASAVIKRLEASIGERLFERSTRRIRLSEAGERLLPHARDALQALARAESSLLHRNAQQWRGPLRLSLPSDLARGPLLGWIEAYLAQHATDSTLELRVSDRLADLLEQPVDFAVRYGIPQDSGLIALPLAPQNRRILCAAPAYLARHGSPATVAELGQHNCLRFVLGDAVYSRWHFDGAGMIEVSGDRIADDGGIVRQWALAGLGICYKSRLDIAADLAAGRLQQLLPQASEAAPLYLLAVSKHHITAAIRLLAQNLAERCAAALQ